MGTEPDFIRRAITTHLAPMLLEAGFYRYKPKHFLRIRGEIIDAIGFQISQWGGRGFYVHRYVNLISSPILSVDSYRIGSRIDHPPNREFKWEGPDESSANNSLLSVAKVTEAAILPWFNSITSARDYIFEHVSDPNTKLDDLTLAVALIRAGTTNRSWWICQALKDENNHSPPIEDFKRKQMKFAADLQAALDDDTHKQLLASWRRTNIEQFKLAPLLAHNS